MNVFGVTNILVIDPDVRSWCKLPYPRHKQGCPNFGKSENCPPKVPTVEKIFDLSKPTWFAYIIFDLSIHAKIMKIKHPEWSEKQCRCCLYWQNTVRHQLQNLCGQFIIKNTLDCTWNMKPEALGINVFETCRRASLLINRDAFPIIYKIALIGTPIINGGLL